MTSKAFWIDFMAPSKTIAPRKVSAASVDHLILTSRSLGSAGLSARAASPNFTTKRDSRGWRSQSRNLESFAASCHRKDHVTRFYRRTDWHCCDHVELSTQLPRRRRLLRIVRTLGSSLRKHFFERADSRKHARRLNRHEDYLRIVALGHIAQAFDVARGDQVLRRIPVFLHCLRYLRNRLGLSLGLPEASLRQSFGLQNIRLLFTFRTRHGSLLFAFRTRDRRLPFALSL